MSSVSYTISPRRRLLLLCVAGLFLFIPTALLVCAAFSSDAALITAGAIVTCIMLPFAVFMCFCAWYPRLTVADDGIHLRGIIGFAPFSVAWEMLENLRLNPGSEALILRQALQTRAARSWSNWSGVNLSGSPLYDDAQKQLINAALYVPIEAFAWWFEYGDLLAAMRKHAPAIFEHFEARRAAAKQARKSDRKMITIVSAITASVIALAVIAGIYYSDTFDGSKIGSIANLTMSSLGYVVALVLGLYAICNLATAFRFATARKFGLAIFWLVAAIVQFLLAILAVARSSGF